MTHFISSYVGGAWFEEIEPYKRYNIVSEWGGRRRVIPVEIGDRTVRVGDKVYEGRSLDEALMRAVDGLYEENPGGLEVLVMSKIANKVIEGREEK